jgi:hypothetical protein
MPLENAANYRCGGPAQAGALYRLARERPGCGAMIRPPSATGRTLQRVMHHKLAGIGIAPGTNRYGWRCRILKILRGTTSHATVELVYAKMRWEFPLFSMGSACRNLGQGMEPGIVKRVGFGNTFARDEANPAGHDRLVCDRCGSVPELEVPIDESLTWRLDSPFGRW